MARKAADAAIGATEQALIEMGREHSPDIRLVHPAHTTMDCTSSFGTCLHLHRLRSRVPQGQELRHVMLVRAGLHPAGAGGFKKNCSTSPRGA